MDGNALLKNDGFDNTEAVNTAEIGDTKQNLTARQFNFVCKTKNNIHLRALAVYAFSKITEILSTYGYEVIKSESPDHQVELRIRKIIPNGTDDSNEEAAITEALQAEPSLKMLRAKNLNIRHRTRKKGLKKIYKYELEAADSVPVVGLCSIAFKRNNIEDIVDQKAIEHASSRIQKALRDNGWHIYAPTIASEQDLFNAEKLVTEPVTARTVEALFNDVVKADQIRCACLSVAEAHDCKVEYGLGSKQKDMFIIDQSSLTFCLSATVGMRL